MSARDAKALEADLLLNVDVAAEPAQPSDGLRAAVLRSLATPGSLAGFARRMAEFFDLGEERALELLGSAARPQDAAWEPARLTSTLTVSGARFLHFAGGPRVAEADCGLVQIEPGVRFPEHVHEGNEWSLVVAGAAEEEGTGATWLPGDLVHRPSGSRHAFRVTSREAFVFAVILEGPVRVVERLGE